MLTTRDTEPRYEAALSQKRSGIIAIELCRIWFFSNLAGAAAETGFVALLECHKKRTEALTN